jgi:putative tryptophan/tyrosine transport system substrate-binding protein
VNAKDPHMSRSVLERTQAAGLALNVSVDLVEISEPDEIDGAFAATEQKGIKAAIFMQDPLFFNERRRIARLGLDKGVATMVASSVMVDDGCLISYGPNHGLLFRRVGSYVDRIFKGQSPGNIPIEEPTRLELVLNSKTADALGITMSPSLLLQADRTVGSRSEQVR